MGLERAAAARFSFFLLGIPAITLAGLVQLKDAMDAGLGNEEMVSLVVGTSSEATYFSYAAISLAITLSPNQEYLIFIWYRLAFGVAILGAIFSGLLKIVNNP